MDLAAWFQELKRRRVIRALLGWGLVSFAVLQVIEPVMHGLELPDWTLKAAIWTLAAGFPVTSILAWIFDLGPGGITRTISASPGDDGAAERARPHLGWALGGLVVATALLGAALGFAGIRRAMPPPAVGPDGRVTVAVADFANETKDPDLDGLGDLFVTSLEQSRKLRVLTRSRMADVLRQLGKSPTQVIDEPLARELGRREGVRALLHASIRRLGDTYAVNLKALDPVRDEYLFTIRERASGKDGILDLVDRLSEQARIRLQEPDASVRGSEVRVAEAATGTLEAWRHYVDGLRYEDVGRIDAAVDEWKKAVEIDPRFALAWFRISFDGEAAGLPAAERRSALEAALKEVDRLPAKERSLVLSLKAQSEGRPDEALALLVPVAEEFPRDKEIQAFAGWAAWNAKGPAVAEPWFERAIALDPAWGQAMDSLAMVLSSLGRHDEAIARARAWVARGPDVTALRLLAQALQFAGRPEEAATEARRILELDGSAVARGWVAPALTLADRPEEAEALLRPVATADAPGEVVEALADALESQGRRRESLEVASRFAQPAKRAWARHVILMGDHDPGPSDRAGWEALKLGVYAWSLGPGAAYLRDGKLFEAAMANLPVKPTPTRTLYEALADWMQGNGVCVRSKSCEPSREPCPREGGATSGVRSWRSSSAWWRRARQQSTGSSDSPTVPAGEGGHGRGSSSWRPRPTRAGVIVRRRSPRSTGSSGTCRGPTRTSHRSSTPERCVGGWRRRSPSPGKAVDGARHGPRSLVPGTETAARHPRAPRVGPRLVRRPAGRRPHPARVRPDADSERDWLRTRNPDLRT